MADRPSLYLVYFFSRSDTTGDWTSVLVKAATDRRAISKARVIVDLAEFPYVGNVVRVR